MPVDDRSLTFNTTCWRVTSWATKTQCYTNFKSIKNSAHQIQSLAESLEHLSDVSSLLHRDQSGVILLVDPHKECFGIVVPDSTAIWPITSHTRGQKERRDRLIKQEMVLEIKCCIFIITTLNNWQTEWLSCLSWDSEAKLMVRKKLQHNPWVTNILTCKRTRTPTTSDHVINMSKQKWWNSDKL